MKSLRTQLVTFYSTHKKTIIALVCASAFSVITAYATPPGSPYSAGATLDPACAPGSSNCTVLIIPDQTGNGGKYLTTDGSTLSWGTVSGGGNLIGSTSTLGVETWLGTAAAGLGTASDVYTVFIGIGTGANATNANLSNFIGYQAGGDATEAHDSNFIGNGAGAAATSAYLSNFFGVDTGANATYATRSIFIGQSAGDSAGADVTYDGVNSGTYFESVFMGFEAGKNGTYADNSNFIGQSAGSGATNANNSNFFGQTTGLNAANASESVFIGYRAGRNATDASSSTFLGSNAGFNASGAFGSFFASTNAGLNATNASESIFIGQQSGNGAAEANHSIFIGQGAGSSAANANTSIFIGNGAGVDDVVDNSTTGDGSILIGQNTSTGGFSNSIALGSNATNTATNQLMVGSTTRRIDNLVFNGGTGNTCSVDASTGITCSSDERLKTNITDIESTLSDVMNLRTVTYNWKTDPDGKPMIGFIAQNLQQYFPQLVTENLDGMLSVNYAQITPVLVRAIQELNVKVGSLSDLTAPSTDGVIGLIRSWLADAGNTIEQLFAKQITTKELCLADDSGATTCINKSELDALIGGTQPQVVSDSAPAEQQEEVVPEQTDPEPEIVPEPEIAPDTPVADQEVVAE